MIVLLTIFMLFNLVIFLSFLRCKNRRYKGVHKFFAPFSNIIIGKFRMIGDISPNRDKFRALNIDRANFIEKSVITALEVAYICMTISILVIGKDVYIQDYKISRPGYEERDKNLDINFETSSEKGSFNININKQVHDKNYIESHREEIRRNIEKQLLGENEDLSNIIHELNFFPSYPSIDATINWEYDTKLFDIDGRPINSIEKEINTKITARLETKEGYEFSEEYEIKIPKGNKITNNIKDYIKQDDKYVYLPSEIVGNKISWKKEVRENPIKYIVISIGVFLIIVFISFKQINEKYNRRLFELQKEYPYLISVLVLYMETGLGLSQSWMQLCSSYDGTDTAIAKELSKTVNNIKAGKSIDIVFSDFASSCNLKEYRKLAQLITQNVRRGSSSILDLLRQEMIIVEKDRMNFAKILAKKAETKLLIPLMIMLVLVFIIILAPSMLSFKL